MNAELYTDHVRALTEGTRKALEAEGLDAMVVHSGALELKSHFDDQDWPLKPVPTFEHWAQLPWPDSLVVVSDAEAKLVARRGTSFWERPAEPDWATLGAGLEVVEARSDEEVQGHLPQGKVAFVGHQSAAAKKLGLDAVNPGGLIERLHDLRVCKSPWEVACLAEASRIAARGHAAVAEAFAAGARSELELHLVYLKATGQDDAQTPYKNIVALGDAAAILHHISYRDLPNAASLLIDAGATHNAYASDITRTYAAAPGAFADLIEAMTKLKNDIIGRVQVGLPYEDLHDQSHELLAQVLIDAEILTCDAERAVQDGLTRKFFPHGLGHSLGVQVHDVGCKKTAPKARNPWLRNTSTIVAGQVFTIEPGLYFIGTLLDELRASHADAVNWGTVEALTPCGGIRIEDNVLVQNDGVRNLTAEAFAALSA